jgi:N-acetylmuramoyl-L-alanine amidase
MRVRTLLPLAAALTLVAPAVAQAAFQHVVASGESLSSVAAADGLTVAQLAAANGVSPDSQLTAGSTLMIPPQSGGSASTAGSSAGGAGVSTVGDGDGEADDTGSSAVSTGASGGTGGSYVVQPGDTLSGIAALAGVSVAELAAANGLDPNAPLPSGKALTLSGSGSGTTFVSTSSSSTGASEPVGAVAQGDPSNPPYPTPERVSASEVGQIASANGVPPSLAEAVGWQESGFNNDLVSAADARGVMQILPGTWDWIQRSLTADSPLAPASAADNVRGGVLLLHSLLGATGGDPAMAAAGYYQGLSSVRANGMYSDTQQYVNSVLSRAQRFGGG